MQSSLSVSPLKLILIIHSFIRSVVRSLGLSQNRDASAAISDDPRRIFMAVGAVPVQPLPGRRTSHRASSSFWLSQLTG